MHAVITCCDIRESRIYISAYYIFLIKYSDCSQVNRRKSGMASLIFWSINAGVPRCVLTLITPETDITYGTTIVMQSIRMVFVIALNSLRPRQNGRHFADDIFKCIFLNENVWISIKILLKFVPKGPISNIPALVQIMAWRRPGDMPLSEPMVVSLPTHICVTRPQWVNWLLLTNVHHIGPTSSVLVMWFLVSTQHTGF